MSTDPVSEYADLIFDRYEVNDIESVAPLLRDRGPVIYILEFGNGDRYVGQAVNFVRRFAQHRHGGTHHSPWEDIIAVQVVEVLAAQLSDAERVIIGRERRAGHHLRNRVYNIDNDLPSALDTKIPVREQQHWATGHGSFDHTSFAKAANRSAPEGLTRLGGSSKGKAVILDGRTVADAVLDDVAVVIANTIPNAVQLEGEYWTLSDFPSTSRGRYATLNVGYLEMLYFPRHPLEMVVEDGMVIVEHAAVLNLPVGTMGEPGDKPEDGYAFDWPTGECFTWLDVARPSNRGKDALGTRTDQIVMPIGTLSADFEAVDLLEPMRELALKLMRRSSARIYAKSHSAELARLAYERVDKIGG
jgi:hypothetical protein